VRQYCARTIRRILAGLTEQHGETRERLGIAWSFPVSLSLFLSFLFIVFFFFHNSALREWIRQAWNVKVLYKFISMRVYANRSLLEFVTGGIYSALLNFKACTRRLSRSLNIHARSIQVALEENPPIDFISSLVDPSLDDLSSTLDMQETRAILLHLPAASPIRAVSSTMHSAIP